MKSGWQVNNRGELGILSKYRKKPVVVEAFQWTGGHDQIEDPEWIIKAIEDNWVYFINENTKDVALIIVTFEGLMRAEKGDYIIKGVQDELYPCKPDVFEATYEFVADET